MTAPENIVFTIVVIGNLFCTYLAINDGHSEIGTVIAFLSGALAVCGMAENEWPHGWWGKLS